MSHSPKRSMSHSPKGSINFLSRIPRMKTLLTVLLVGSSMALYQNCSEGSLNSKSSASNSAAGSESTYYPSPELNPGETTKLDVNPVALMSSRELLASFRSLTGIDFQNTADQTFSSQEAILSSNNRLDQINAPLLIATTTVAGDYCVSLVDSENVIYNNMVNPKIKAPDTRVFFKGLNQSGSGEMTPAEFKPVVSFMADRFWGRAATAEESAALEELRTMKMTAGTASTRRSVLISTCSAMLSSFDSQTL